MLNQEFYTSIIKSSGRGTIKIHQCFSMEVTKMQVLNKQRKEREREKYVDRTLFLPARQRRLENRAPAQKTTLGDFLCFSSRPRCIIPAE